MQEKGHDSETQPLLLILLDAGHHGRYLGKEDILMPAGIHGLDHRNLKSGSKLPSGPG